METFISLIKNLKDRGMLENKKFFNAFTKIDRKNFITKELQDFAYEDEPLTIGEGQTISQPYTVAFMFNLLKPKKGDKILDVGSGSGYTTALLAEIVGEEGKIIGVELIPELVAFGNKNIEKYNLENAEINQAGEILGFSEKAPYDKILVSATTYEIPQDLLQQLKVGGVMVIPIGHDIWKIKKKSNNNLKIEKHHGFSFVPLVENKQWAVAKKDAL